MNNPWTDVQGASERPISWLTSALPNRIVEIIRDRIWAEHTRPDGKPFESFYEAAVTALPHGLGLDGVSTELDYMAVVGLCEMGRRRDVAAMMRGSLPPIGPVGRQKVTD